MAIRVYNTKGELVSEINLNSEITPGGQKQVWIYDDVAHDLLEGMLTELKIARLHWQEVTGENFKKEDINELN